MRGRTCDRVTGIRDGDEFPAAASREGACAPDGANDSIGQTATIEQAQPGIRTHAQPLAVAPLSA